MTATPFDQSSVRSLDLLALGEVMLRFDPGAGRIRTTRRFDVWEGGGEYNVARGLRKCFGMNTAVATGLVDNEIGHLVEDLILQGGVDTTLIQWFPFDGTGRGARVGLNFTERGFGVRGALGVSDRGHSAASLLDEGCIDWDEVFKAGGVGWLHTGGIFAGLSESSSRLVARAIEAARSHGVTVSFDLNYRPSLWSSRGGEEAAQSILRPLASNVDVLLGNEEDYAACLGLEIPGLSADLRDPRSADYGSLLQTVAATYPNVSVVTATLRGVHSASSNDWSAIGWSRGSGLQYSIVFEQLEIFDRLGGGDGFASGLIYGLMRGKSFKDALDYGVCHGALAMTTPGDTSMVSVQDVEQLVRGGSARVVR